MELGEKMLPGSIVALLLGVLLAAPLLYTNLAVEPVAAAPEQMLDVDIKYAYIEQDTTSEIPAVKYFVASNSTRMFEDIDPCDAKILVYLVNFYSDNGFVEKVGMLEGLIYNPDRLNKTLTLPFGSFIEGFRAAKLYGDSEAIAGGASFGMLNVGESRTGGQSGYWYSSIGESESISVKVSLIGWISVTGNSTNTVVLQEAQVVTEVQMEKFGDGFLYKNMIPEDELSDIDPANPLWNLFKLNGDFD